MPELSPSWQGRRFYSKAGLGFPGGGGEAEPCMGFPVQKCFLVRAQAPVDTVGMVPLQHLPCGRLLLPCDSGLNPPRGSLLTCSPSTVTTPCSALPIQQILTE